MLFSAGSMYPGQLGSFAVLCVSHQPCDFSDCIKQLYFQRGVSKSENIQGAEILLTIFPQNESGRWEYAGKQKAGKRRRMVSSTRRLRMVCFSVSAKIIFFSQPDARYQRPPFTFSTSMVRSSLCSASPTNSLTAPIIWATRFLDEFSAI